VNLPNVKKPCKDCPFNMNCKKGWLGNDRIIELLYSDSFVCHKRTDKQCAGHMLINGEANAFVRLAKALEMTIELSGRELVFNNHADCIKHHT
jgi:hypothetical protein